MRLFKLLLFILLTTLTLQAQPAFNEQVLTANGGDAVAMSGEYAIVGDADTHIVHFYRLDYSSFTWVDDGSYQGSATNGNLGFSVAIDGNIAAVGSPQFTENRIFRFRGANTQEFDEYLIATDTWAARTPAPDTIGHGGALAWGGGNFIYALRGENGGINSKPTDTFYIYDIAAGTWASGPNTPKKVGKGGALAWDGGNYIYAFRGDKNSDFWRFNISGNSWEGLAGAPNHIGYGGSLVVVDGYVYGTRGDGSTFGSSKTFYRYDPAANTWATLADIPKGVGKGGSLTSDGTTIYLTRGNDGTLTDKKKFYAYDIATNTWSERAEMPNGVGKGGALVFDGTFLYVQRGDTSFFGGNNNFWRYDTIRNVWLGDLTEPPDNTGGGGALTVVKDAPGEGIVYVFERNIATNVWERKLRISLKDPVSGDNLGYAVGIRNNNDGTAEIAMGSPGRVSSTTGGVGSADRYAYDSANLPVSGNVEIVASEGADAASVSYGYDLDIKGQYLIVSDTNRTTQTGSAFTYKQDLSTGTWAPWPATNEMSGYGPGSQFGKHIAINIEGNTSVVTDRTANAYRYNNDGSSWSSGSDLPGYVADTDIDDGIELLTNTNGRLLFVSESGSISLWLKINTGAAHDALKSSVSLYKEQYMVNDPDNNQTVVGDVPCGIKPTHLVANEWAMISLPCNSSATVLELFGDDVLASGDGTYCQTDSASEACNWVMYKDGADYNGSSDANVRVLDSESMVLGKGYWIIADHDVTLKVDDNVGSQRTTFDTLPADNIIAGEFTFDLPALQTSDPSKKIMVGNPFPRAFDWALSRTQFNATANPIGGFGIIENVAYVYDTTQSGQPYRAINYTPGFPNVINPYQGFWIKMNPTTVDLTAGEIKLRTPYMK